MGTDAQRNKRRGKRSKARRLLDVQVNEISLVDDPAVPEATFCIAKRDAQPEEVEKFDDGEIGDPEIDGQSDGDVICDKAAGMYKISGFQLASISKAAELLNKIAKGARAKRVAGSVTGKDGVRKVDESPDVETEEPAEVTKAEPSPSILEQAGMMLARRQAERVAKAKGEQDRKIVDSLNKLTSKFEACLERTESLHKQFEEARGKVDDSDD